VLQRQKQRELIKLDEREKLKARAAVEGLAQARLHRMAAPLCSECNKCEGYEIDKVLVWQCMCGHHRRSHSPDIGIKATALR